MGSATLYQLAARGVRALGIDQFAPPHALGSSHGESRITRLAVGEGAAYVPLVRRNHEIWRELETASGETLLTLTGGLIIGPENGGGSFHGVDDFVAETAGLARQHGIAHQRHTSAELRKRFPMLKVGAHEQAIYEPTGGIVHPERAVAVQLDLARRLSAEVHTGEKVLSVSCSVGGVTITTTQATYASEKLVLTAGPWIADLLDPELRHPFGIYRQVFYWFEAEDLDLFRCERFPFVIWIGDAPADYYSLFPTPPGGTEAVKMATEQYLAHTHPDEVERTVEPHEIEHMANHFVRNRVDGVTDRCVRATVCLYTVTSDEHFIIDWHPGSERVLVASPCSGHGFKHSPAIGEALAQLVVDGRSEIELSSFQFNRFSK